MTLAGVVEFGVGNFQTRSTLRSVSVEHSFQPVSEGVIYVNLAPQKEAYSVDITQAGRLCYTSPSRGCLAHRARCRSWPVSPFVRVASTATLFASFTDSFSLFHQLGADDRHLSGRFDAFPYAENWKCRSAQSWQWWLQSGRGSDRRRVVP